MTKGNSPISAQSLSIKQVTCIALALIPFGSSITAHALGSKEQKPTLGPTRPALVFDQYHVNKGFIPQGVKTVYAHFRFHNSSSRDVEVTDLKPSCGCLRPFLKVRKFKPKEGSEFSLRVETTSETPGRHDYHVDVHYKDPEPRVVRLTFRVQLPEPSVQIRPVGLLFYQLNGTESHQTAVITDYRPDSFSIRNVRSTNEYASAEVAKTEINDAGHTSYHISVYVSGHIPPGTDQDGRILIETDDPEYKTLTLPLKIVGPKKATGAETESESIPSRLKKASAIDPELLTNPVSGSP